MNVYCRICGEPGAACGDSHQTLPLLTGAAFFRGDSSMTDPRMSETNDTTNGPQELEEYHYYVGHMETTAMLTPAMAERLGAKPVGEALDEPDGGKKGNNEANRLSTQGGKADKDGVTNAGAEEAQEKARTARNKRATGGGGS